MIVHTYVYKHAHSYNIEEISYIYMSLNRSATQQAMRIDDICANC